MDNYVRISEDSLSNVSYYDKDGKLHRTDGPAEISKDGSRKVWYRHGVAHREDGPAVEDYLVNCWYNQGVLHRLDGPAIIWTEKSNDPGYKQFLVEGIPYEEKEYNELPAVKIYKNKKSALKALGISSGT